MASKEKIRESHRARRTVLRPDLLDSAALDRDDRQLVDELVEEREKGEW